MSNLKRNLFGKPSITAMQKYENAELESVQEHHHEYLKKFLFTVNSKLLKGYTVVHVCYMKLIKDESKIESSPDVFYLDYPYSDKTKEFAEYLAQNENLEIVNKKIVKCFQDFQNINKEEVGYLHYKYKLKNNQILAYEPNSNMGSKNVDLYLKYLPILDASVNENDSYLINNIVLDKSINPTNEYYHFCDSFENHVDYADGYYLYTVHIENDSFDKNIFLREVVPLIKEMLFMYFYGPISEFTTSLQKKATKEISELQLFKQEVDNISHTIFNVLPNALTIIDDANTKIKEFDYQTKELLDIDKALKQLKIIDLGFRIVGNKLIDEVNGKNTFQIFDFINQNYPLSELMDVKIDLRAYQADLDNFYSRKEAIDVFSIIFNLYSNATKARNREENKRGETVFKIFFNDGNIAFSFKNYVRLCNDIPFIIDKLTKDDRAYRSKGLGIVRQKVKALNWHLDIKNETKKKDNFVEIIIITNSKK